MMNKIISLVVLTFLVLPAAAQQLQLEVIPLNHSTPEQVISVIRPLLAPGGTVTGMNNQLIVKTTPGNLAEIKQVLGTIDRPLRRLMITVQQGINRTSDGRNLSVSGEYRSGNAGITGNTGRQTGGITISGRDDDGNVIRYNVEDSSSTSDNSNTYSVQALEGQPAYIQTGRSVPVPAQNTVITRNGVVIQNSTEYYDASSGFYVLPRVSGNIVTLMIAPRMSEVNPGRVPTFEIQNVETTVSGRLGEWIDIGGLSQVQQGGNRGLLSGGNTQRQEQRSILIKVDEIR
jgi:type II secretory pathway component GspD/PulD (secretin)